MNVKNVELNSILSLEHGTSIQVNIVKADGQIISELIK
jgi:hypothetical protein